MNSEEIIQWKVKKKKNRILSSDDSNSDSKTITHRRRRSGRVYMSDGVINSTLQTDCDNVSDEDNLDQSKVWSKCNKREIIQDKVKRRKNRILSSDDSDSDFEPIIRHQCRSTKVHVNKSKINSNLPTDCDNMYIFDKDNIIQSKVRNKHNEREIIQRKVKKRKNRILSSDDSDSDSGPITFRRCRSSRVYVSDDEVNSTSQTDCDSVSDEDNVIQSKDRSKSNEQEIIQWKVKRRKNRILSSDDSDSEPFTPHRCRSSRVYVSDSEINTTLQIDCDKLSDEDNVIQSKVRNKGHEQSVESDESDGDSGPDGKIEKCPICLEKFKNQELGMPENCDHTFCLECIVEWSKIQISPVESLALPDTFEPDLHLLTVCEVCDSGDTEDQLLLCDGCDRGYHCYCLSPTLDEIPIEEWFCSDCAGQVTPEIEESISRRLIARTRASESVIQHVNHNRSERNDSRPSTSTSRSTTRKRRRQKRRKSTTKSTSDKFLRRTRYGDISDLTDLSDLESERLFCAGQVTPEIEESISRRLIARTRASERNDSRPSTSTSRSTARERRRQKRRKSTTKSTSDKFLRRTRYGDLTDLSDLESERLFCAGQVTPEIEESISRRLIARTRASERNDSRPSTSTSRSTARERRKEKSRKSTTKNTTDKFLRRTRYGDIIDLTDSSDHKSESTDSEEPIDSETFSETDSDTMISTRSSTSSLRKIVKRGLVTVDGPSTSSGSKVKKTKFIDKSGDFGASNGSVDILDSILKHQSLLHSKSPDSNVTTVSKNLPQCQKPPKDKCYEIAKDLTDVDMDVDTSSYSSDGNMLQISPAKPSTQPSKSGVKTEIPALKTTNDLKTNPINLSLVTNNQMHHTLASEGVSNDSCSKQKTFPQNNDLFSNQSKTAAPEKEVDVKINENEVILMLYG
ncbi:PHD and RING finger domain-containing protein 1 [Nymphon striatum]|nr:PHD and RING finger domain-containing protein 1 [Nymphon striatum]